MQAAALVVAALTLVSCAADPDAGSTVTSPTTAAVDARPSPEPALDECSIENLTVVNPGQLTVGTVGPREEPYYYDSTPGSGEGFEAALVFAIAQELGFRPTQVDWRAVPQGAPLDPLAERRDFLIGRITVDDASAAGVSSDPYLQSVRSGEDDVTEGAPPVVTSYALLFAPGDPLVTCVNGVLAEMTANGELTEIASTWLPPVEDPLSGAVDDTLPAVAEGPAGGSRVS